MWFQQALMDKSNCPASPPPQPANAGFTTLVYCLDGADRANSTVELARLSRATPGSLDPIRRRERIAILQHPSLEPSDRPGNGQDHDPYPLVPLRDKADWLRESSPAISRGEMPATIKYGLNCDHMGSQKIVFCAVLLGVVLGHQHRVTADPSASLTVTVEPSGLVL